MRDIRFARREVLNEGNPLSRIFSTLKDSNKVMVIISASRNEKTDEENKRDNAELRKTLRKYGFGYRTAEGHYPEEHEGERIDHIDDSTIVISSFGEDYDLFRIACDLAKEYKQECFLYKDPAGEVSLVDPNGKTICKLGEFHPNRVSDYMTTMKKNKSFVFESISEYKSAKPNSYAEALLIRSRRKNLID